MPIGKIPSIQASAQARLLLYKLISSKLARVQQKLLEADPHLLEQIVAKLEASMLSSAELKLDESILEQAFASIERATREGLQRQVKLITSETLWLGRHPTKLLNDFLKEHQVLIKSVETEHFNKINLAIKRGIREGRLIKDISSEIHGTTDICKRRVQLIARNSVLQYSGSVTKHHQISAGFTKYKWQTSNDERVRDSHKEKDGKIFSWDGPGSHPRNEVNCRCDAIPVAE